MGSINMNFLDPILTIRLIELNVAEANAGIGFVVVALTYTLGSLILSSAIDRFSIEQRVSIGVCLVLCAVADALMSSYYRENIYLVLVAIGIQGFFMPGILIPSLPEMLDAISE